MTENEKKTSIISWKNYREKKKTFQPILTHAWIPRTGLTFVNMYLKLMYRRKVQMRMLMDIVIAGHAAVTEGF